MVIPWSIPLVIELYVYGSLIWFCTFRNWHKPEFNESRLNNLLYGLMYFVIGSIMPTLFQGDNLPVEFENQLFMYIFIVLFIVDIFWWVFNIGPNLYQCAKDPVEKAKPYRQYENLINQLKDHKSSSITKDITRKFLHVLMMGIVMGTYIWARGRASSLETTWFNYWSFCKFIYIILGFAFCNMFVIGDLVRMNTYHGLPGWARKWYGSSLEAKEMYVFISSIPYILTMALLMWTPIQVIFIALVVSAVGDGSASIIGKSIGKHKFPKWLDGKKSFEGLFAGTLASLLSSILILMFFPFPNQTGWLVLCIGLGSAAIFAFNDMFNRKIADNITNSLLPALFAWSLAAFFGGL